MDKAAVISLANTMAEATDGMAVADVFEHIGAAIGIVALTLEQQNNVDRTVTFKMLQRNGHALIKELESARKEQ